MGDETNTAMKQEDRSGTQKASKKKHGVLYWLIQIVVWLFVVIVAVGALSTPRHFINLWNDTIRYTVQDEIMDCLGTSDVLLRQSDDFGKDNILSTGKIKLNELQKSLLEAANNTTFKDTFQEYAVEASWHVWDSNLEHIGNITVNAVLWVQGDYYNIYDISFTADEKLADNLSAIQEQALRKMIDYKDSSLVVDDFGNLAVRVYYQFTNITSNPTSAGMNTDISAFQSGMSLSCPHGGSSGGEYRDIQPGYTIDLYIEYTLSDGTTPVEVIFAGGIYGDGNRYSVTIDPSELQETEYVTPDSSFSQNTSISSAPAEDIPYDWIYSEWTVPHMATQKLEMYEVEGGLELYVIDTFSLNMDISSEPDIILDGVTVYYDKTLDNGSLVFAGGNCELLYDGSQITLTVDGISTNYINL